MKDMEIRNNELHEEISNRALVCSWPNTDEYDGEFETSILDSNETPLQLKNLSVKELKQLAYEIRRDLHSILWKKTKMSMNPSLAATVVDDVTAEIAIEVVMIENEVVLKTIDHEFSDYTRRLLERVKVLVKSIEKVKKKNGYVAEVGTTLKAVKVESEKLQKEIMIGLYSEMRQLRKEKEVLIKQIDEIINEDPRLKKDTEKLLRKDVRKKVDQLEETVNIIENEYNKIWEMIDDAILKKGTTLSFEVRELISIVRECVELVKGFNQNQELKQKKKESFESFHEGSITKLQKVNRIRRRG